MAPIEHDHLASDVDDRVAPAYNTPDTSVMQAVKVGHEIVVI